MLCIGVHQPGLILDRELSLLHHPEGSFDPGRPQSGLARVRRLFRERLLQPLLFGLGPSLPDPAFFSSDGVAIDDAMGSPS